MFIDIIITVVILFQFMHETHFLHSPALKSNYHGMGGDHISRQPSTMVLFLRVSLNAAKGDGRSPK